MKYFKLILTLVLVALMFSGCSFKVSSSIDDLISPLSPFGDNADIKNALDSYLPNGYSLKAPSAGKYITSYNFFDIDGDKQDEAVAFYEPSDNLGEIDLAVIKKADDEWKVVDNIKGEGKDVSSIGFADLDGKGKHDLIVCWDVISHSTSHQLCVYRPSVDKNAIKLNKIGDSISVNNFVTADMYGDSTEELLLFELNSSSSSAKAILYSLKDDDFKKLGETKLDSHITSYSTLTVEKSESKARVYADAIMSDGTSMLTELIFWSDGYDTIISPFFSYSSGMTKDTRRNAIVSSFDINADKSVDIPVDYKIKKLPKEIKGVEFKSYKQYNLYHSAYALLCDNDKYLVVIPDKMIDKITASYNKNTREMTVIDKRTKKSVFSVMPVLKATYDRKKHSGYTVALEDNGYDYLIRQGNSDLKINDNELKNYIKTVE